MPRKFMFTKEEILHAALDLVREKGFSAVTARALGGKLGTSAQPVFGHFENMEDVKASIIRAADELYGRYLKEDMESGKYPPYKASGMSYIRFAREEKELFKLLFMRDRTGEDRTAERPETEMIATLVSRQVNISKEQAMLFPPGDVGLCARHCCHGRHQLLRLERGALQPNPDRYVWGIKIQIRSAKQTRHPNRTLTAARERILM